MKMPVGEKHVHGLQNLSRLMSHHGHGKKPCKFLNVGEGGAVLCHVMEDHKERLGLAFGVDEAIRRLKNLSLNFVYVFWTL